MRLDQAAREFIGVPFKFRGRTSSGCDCSGHLVLAQELIGRPVQNRINYGREPWNDGIEESLDAEFDIVTDEIQPGDIVLLCLEGRNKPGHIGIVGEYYNGGLSLIHTRCDTKEVIETNFDPERPEGIIHKVYRNGR